MILEDVCHGLYCLEKKIGNGSFGEIYSGIVICKIGICNFTKRKVAIKIVIYNTLQEENNKKKSQLKVEYRIYKQLQGGTGIPELYNFATEGDRNYLIIELLGKSLESLLRICHGKFSISTGFELALQMVHCS